MPVAQPSPLFNPPFKYSVRDTPEENAACTFESHDPSERPPGLQPATHSTNVVFLQRPMGPLWSHAEGERAIAEITPSDLIILARYQKTDLWIRAKKPRVTLETSPEKLTCY